MALITRVDAETIAAQAAGLVAATTLYEALKDDNCEVLVCITHGTDEGSVEHVDIKKDSTLRARLMEAADRDIEYHGSMIYDAMGIDDD